MKKLIKFTPESERLLKLHEGENVTKLVNDAVIAQLAQGEAAARAKLRILLQLAEKEEKE